MIANPNCGKDGQTRTEVHGGRNIGCVAQRIKVSRHEVAVGHVGCREPRGRVTYATDLGLGITVETVVLDQ
jgi:hypothetical protein